MPAARTPAQIEAARRNGARSHGPVTPEGKTRSSANALKHGLAAAQHLLLEGEDRAAYEELLTDLVKELAPDTELAAQLVRRLAAALWKQHRADRLEAKLFAWTATPKVIHGGRYQPVDAEAAFDLARFAAVQRYQAQLGREVSRLLREVRLLRKEALSTASESRNEPGPAPAPAALPGQADRPGGPGPSPPAAARAAARFPDRPSPVTAGLDPTAPPAADDEGRGAARLRRGSACRTPPPSPPP